MSTVDYALNRLKCDLKWYSEKRKDRYLDKNKRKRFSFGYWLDNSGYEYYNGQLLATKQAIRYLLNID